ncbi:MAG: hypothetical protein WAU75_05955 [Solirubrobacteraceae bacterium]
MASQPQSDVTKPAPTVTEAVTTALGLGWQMARLFAGQLSSNGKPKLDDDLPGLSKLPAASLVELGLVQADTALIELEAFLGPNTSLPGTQAVHGEVSKEPPDRNSIRQAILDLHVALLVNLTAADYRLGKAYGLGRALADTAASLQGEPAARQRALAHALEPHRALVLVGWLDDLKTVLPAHSGQAVADSLQRWVNWGQAAKLGTLDAEAVNLNARILHRCSQRWRALLSGEKQAKDVLEIGDYVTAAQGMLRRGGAIARAIAWRLKVPLTLADALIVIGIWLMFKNHSSAQVLAGLGTVAGGLGITWRSAAASVGHLSLNVGSPLWAAEIDLVVGSRLTPPPQRDYLPGLKRPASRWRRAWRELSTRDPEAPRGSPDDQNADPVQHGSAAAEPRDPDKSEGAQVPPAAADAGE